MSKRECPTCHYIFLKKKDFIEHVTYSSCAEKLQGILVFCPHCKKQFPDEDSLSYHIMRNEACSSKQDKACDILNRLPSNRSTIDVSLTPQSKTDVTEDVFPHTQKEECNETQHNSTDKFRIRQGIMVNRKRVSDNQHDLSVARRQPPRFVILEEIQCFDDDARP